MTITPTLKRNHRTVELRNAMRQLLRIGATQHAQALFEKTVGLGFWRHDAGSIPRKVEILTFLASSHHELGAGGAVLGSFLAVGAGVKNRHNPQLSSLQGMPISRSIEVRI